MTFSRSRRTALAAACATALLAACGSGSVVSDLDPQRFITVGDGFMDVGQTGAAYTVNDGSLNWAQQLASYYGQTIAPAAQGGWGYAQGHARVSAAHTAPTGVAVPSITAQIDALLARTTLQKKGDVVLVGGGIADIVVAVQATGISDATTEAVKQAGKALGVQIRRLVQAGASHVAVTGVYDLGMSPWARALNARDDIARLTITFNTGLLVEIVDLGDSVLYLDAAQFYNFIRDKPDSYPFDNVTEAVCTTPDASTCNTGTLVAGANYQRWLFADAWHFTPTAQRMFVNETYAENAYTRFKRRW